MKITYGSKPYQPKRVALFRNKLNGVLVLAGVYSSIVIGGNEANGWEPGDGWRDEGIENWVDDMDWELVTSPVTLENE